MIDVKELIERYTIEELIESADKYFANINELDILAKPFNLPEAQHLFTEIGQLISCLNLTDEDVVLDFGCGTGWAGRLINACGCEVVQVDVSANALEVARSLNERWRTGLPKALPPLRQALFNGRRIELPDSSIDKIFTLDSFHHVPNQSQVIDEFSRLLKPGGIVAFCEPGPDHSKTASAQLEMRLHKVIENDIILDEIWKHAKNAGFMDMTVLVTPLMGMMVSLEEYRTFPDNSRARDFLGATNWRTKNYPIFSMRRSGEVELTSRRIDGLACELQLVAEPPEFLSEGTPFNLEVRIRNLGSAKWLPSGSLRGAVNVGILIGDKQLRSHLSDGIFEPGSEEIVSIAFPALPVGQHKIIVDLVAEHVTWFHGVGSKVITLEVNTYPKLIF